MNLTPLKVAIKRRILPDRSFYLRTYFGLAAGGIVHVNPQNELRRYFGLDETQLLPVYRLLLKPGMKSFDVGASTGLNAVGFARQTKAQVVAFEAEPILVEKLRRVVAINALPIYVEAGYVGDGHSPDTISLDHAARKHFFPDFVKMDIEGHEAQALRGCNDLLAGQQTSFVIETHGKDVEDRCVEILRANTFDMEFIEPNRSEKKFRGQIHNRWLIARPKRA
jgi:precorrin-6B methylase 2